MKSPLISIMIPTYNRAKMLAEAVESCVEQDYTNMEVVISDNASLDETPNIMQRYLDDPRIHYYRQPTNISGTPNWCKLVYEYAKGDYGQLLPDDDLISDKHYLAKVADIITETGAKAVFSGFNYVDAASQTQYTRRLRMPRTMTPEQWVDFLGTAQNGEYIFPCFATVYDLELARSLNIYQPAIPGLDFELILRFMLAGPTAYLEGNYCTARQHGGNASRTADKVETYLEGAGMFQRFYMQGLAQGLSRDKLLGAKRRLLVVFAHSFLIRAWVDARSDFPISFRELYQRLAQLDSWVAFRVFLDFPTIAKIILKHSPGSYAFVRRIYGLWLRWRGKIVSLP